MDVGVSTACLYPLETEKALFELAARGVKNVEIFVNSVDELEGSIFNEMKNTIKNYGMSVKSFHPFSSPMETLFIFGNYPRRTDYLMDIYKRYFEKMSEIGARVFVLHGAILSSNVPDERYLERYLRLYRIGKEFGVTVAQENICYCKSCSVNFLKTMSEQLGDEVGFVVDLKQARRSNLNLFQLIEAVGEKIVHMHVSDSGTAGDCMPVGAGDFDFNRLFTMLDKFKYNGTLIVELYRENYRSYDDLADCARRLDNLLRRYKHIV